MGPEQQKFVIEFPSPYLLPYYYWDKSFKGSLSLCMIPEVENKNTSSA